MRLLANYKLSDKTIIKEISNRFKRFSNDNYIKERLSSCIYTDKPENIEIKDIKGVIGSINKITIPRRIDIEIMVHIDKLAINGLIYVHANCVEEILCELIKSGSVETITL